MHNFSQAYTIGIMLPVAAFSGRARVGGLIFANFTQHSGGEQALPVHTPKTPRRIVGGEAFAHHRAAKLVGAPNPCGAGSEDDNLLVAQRRAADADGGDRS